MFSLPLKKLSLSKPSKRLDATNLHRFSGVMNPVSFCAIVPERGSGHVRPLLTDLEVTPAIGLIWM